MEKALRNPSERGPSVSFSFWGSPSFDRKPKGSQAPEQPPSRWVTVKEIAASLPNAPTTVGLDIDDTLIFPSPGFQALLFNTDGHGGSNPYGADMRVVVANLKAWNDLHHQHDNCSLPKAMGCELLALHKPRGDRVHLITARVGIETAPLEARMRKIFGMAFEGPITFTALKSKTEAIRTRKLTLYHGDSDSNAPKPPASAAYAFCRPPTRRLRQGALFRQIR